MAKHIPDKKRVMRRKRTVKLEDRYRLATYITAEDRALIDRALEILGEGSMSGFAARLVIREARRIVDEAEGSKHTTSA